MRAIAYILALASTLVLASGQISLVFEWNSIDYVWPNVSMRDNFIATGQYIARSVVPMDVDRDKAGRVFLSFFGRKGVPAVLGIVTDIKGDKGPLIQPYPSWDWFTTGDCNSLQNVYRIAIDKCNRLWVLDTGAKDGEKNICTPKLVVFDLDTDKHVETILIPFDVANGKNSQSLLATPVIDTEGPNCEATTVYIADVAGNGLLIIKDKRVHRLEHPVFQADPSAIVITSGNVNLRADFVNGILGLAVSPRVSPDEEKRLYFRPLASYDLFMVNVKSLENISNDQEITFHQEKHILSSQAIAMAFAKRGTLFFGLTAQNAIGCLNIYKPLTRENFGIVAPQNLEYFEYLNGVKVIEPSPAHPEEELWVLSNRFIHYMNNLLDPHGINYRVFKSSVQSLVDNSTCDKP